MRCSLALRSSLETSIASDRSSDAWLESEPRTRAAMVVELRRIHRRARARPLPVIGVALAITVATTSAIAFRTPSYRGEVVLAFQEGSMPGSRRNLGLPMGELRALVLNVLLPDARLARLIEARDLYRRRGALGMSWAVTELRSSIEVEVWRNSFAYYDPEIRRPEGSARVRISVSDPQPDRAFAIAHDLGAIVADELTTRHQELARRLADELTALRAAMTERISTLEAEQTRGARARASAMSAGDLPVADAHHARIAAISGERREAERSLFALVSSQDSIADQVADAGLDLVVEVVSERRPARPDDRGLQLAVLAAIVGASALLGSALVLGAFDDRVHEAEDVARMRMPVLGHVPDLSDLSLPATEARGVQGNIAVAATTPAPPWP